MHSQKRSLKKLARNLGIDADDALIILWDRHAQSKKFEYLKNGESIVRDRHLKLVKKNLESYQTGKLNSVKTVVQNKLRPTQNFDFSNIGKTITTPHFLTKEEVILIHEKLVEDFASSDDPIAPCGIKNGSLLEMAIFHPQTCYNFERKYPTIESAAAALMYAISSNHAFHNGNKRTALVAMLVFLDRHNIVLICKEDALFKLSVLLADHKVVELSSLTADAEVHYLAKWIEENSKTFKRGERAVTYRRLMQILGSFGCVYNETTGWVTRRMNPSRWGFAQTYSYKITSSITKGYEVDVNLLKGLRRELRLDAESGIDQEVFYGAAEYSTSEFIHKYRNVLKRLARR